MKNKPIEVYFLLFWLVILVINAVPAGTLLVMKPDGSLLGMDQAWLGNSPFKSYLVPGSLLLVFLGLFPFISLLGLMNRRRWRQAGWLNIYNDMHWGWTYALYSGIITIIWILVQQILTDYSFLQSLVAGLGILIIINCMMPRVIRYYRL